MGWLTSSFEALRFRSKLWVMLFLPLIGLLYLATLEMSTRLTTWQAMLHLENVARFAVQLSTLVHETQKERGLSAGFLGSGGQQFEDELARQREATDAKQVFVTTGLDALRQREARLNSYLSTIATDLAQLKDMRQQVSTQKTNIDAAVKFYSTLNAHILDTIAYLAKLSTDVRINRAVSAYLNLLQNKEHAGIERAILSATFAADRFSPGTYRRVIELLNTQQIYTTMLLALTDEEETRQFIELIDKHTSTHQVSQLEAIALARPEGNFGIDATNFFSLMTAKIDQLKKFEDYLSKRLAAQAQRLFESARQGFWLALAMTFLLVVTALLLGYLTSRSIYRQLGREPVQVVQLAEKIAAGDLRIDTVDTQAYTGLYAAMLVMRQRLRQVVNELQAVASHVNSGSRDISSSAEFLSQGAIQQSETAEQVGASIQAISKSVHTASQYIENTDQTARRAAASALSGNQAFISVIQSIRAIMSKVVVVDEIARRTDLLSINTGIEAAHMGVHGKGFAVLAKEVRHLAERSRQAAAEIGLVSSDGLDIAETAETLLTQLVEDIRVTSDLMAQIKISGDAQSHEVDAITIAMRELESVIQKNASSSEELAATATELASQSEQLQELMVYFKTT